MTIKNPDTYIEIDNSQALVNLPKGNIPFPIIPPEPEPPAVVEGLPFSLPHALGATS